MPRCGMLWSETLARAERWILPGACLLCDGPVPASEDPLVCPLCRHRWVRIPDPVCGRCGQPVETGTGCRVCAGWPERFVQVRSAVWLSGTARDAVHHLKYGGWRRVATGAAEAMRTLEPLAGAAALVPVPLGASRLRARGYNQAAELGRALAERVGLAVREDLLLRARETGTQTRLTPEARVANLAGAFAAASRPPDGPLVLVDDVFTTGATLVSAAEALLARGATEVRAVTFARARRPLDDDVRALTLHQPTWFEESP